MTMDPGLPHSGTEPTLTRDRHGRPRMETTPPLNRMPMAPRAWPRTPFGWLLGPQLSPEDGPPSNPGVKAKRRRVRWQRAAALRRACLVALVLTQTVIATSYMASIVPYQGRQPLEIPMLVLFSVLFAWISAGFWTAMAGFAVMLRGRDRHSISGTAAIDAP